MENYRLERVDKICSDLYKLIVKQSVSVNSWKVKKGFFLKPEDVDRSGVPWENFDAREDEWLGPNEHFWFRTSFDVPKSFAKKPLWFQAVAGSVNGWDAISPQFLLFINGVPVQGMDSNHTEAKLFESAKPGERVVVDLQAYTGWDNRQGGIFPNRLRLAASVLETDTAINECYYDLLVPNQVASQLEREDWRRLRLQAALESAVNLLDLREPYSREFYVSLRECGKYLKNEVYKKLSGGDSVTATCIGNTHIDVAGLWTLEQAREKAVRSFATTLHLMDEYPFYKFMSSQPQLYAFVKERYPELYDKIKRRIKEGRWEAEGGMWLEADCNLTSGESLVRQLQHGKKFLKDEFNVDSHILWLPDSFGFPASLPQIMKKAGMDTFVTSKISWNQFNRFPNDTFWWRGIDGSEVLSSFFTPQNKGEAGRSMTPCNGHLNAETVMNAWDSYQNKELSQDVLIPYGWAGGGGGPTRDMLEQGKRLAAGISGAPKVRTEKCSVYFDQLRHRLAGRNNVPRWVGELYLEYHRGTYTSMARNKRANRRCEQLWQDVEFFSVLCSRMGQPYDTKEIYDSWEEILVNQFHDILPGTSIHDVYETTRVEYERLQSRAEEIIAAKLVALTAAMRGKNGDLVLYNTLSFRRADPVELPIHGYSGVTSFTDEEGNRMPAQHTCDNKVVFCPGAIPAKGYAVYTPNPDPDTVPNELTVKGGELNTPFYRVRFDKTGQFLSLFDKQAGRELLKSGCKGNVLRVYEDRPMENDCGDVDIYYKQKSWDVAQADKLDWVEMGPVRAVLRVERTFLQSRIQQDIIFYAGSRRIDFRTRADWKQHELLLKVEFPLDINANEAEYDIQFGSVRRPAHQNTSWDAARFEVCGQKWADLSEGGYGVALLNDCKYGYSIQDGLMSLSLIKSGVCPNPVTDQEEHRFTYALLPHMGDCFHSNVQQEAYCLNNPAYAARLAGGTPSAEQPPVSLFHLLDGQGNEPDNIFVETVKRSEDGTGVILRIYEARNRRLDISLEWCRDIAGWVECDLLENELTKPHLGGGRIPLTLKPFEIKTLKVIE